MGRLNIAFCLTEECQTASETKVSGAVFELFNIFYGQNVDVVI